MKRAGVAVLAAAALALAGCTGVPSSSAPQIVQHVGVAQPQPRAVETPQPGANPRAIVSGFLANNATEESSHAAARAYLTPDAKTLWNDGSQTTIIQSAQIGTYQAGSVTVTGQAVGTIGQDGSYRPAVDAANETFTFGLRQSDGQWRIDSLAKGTIITATQFSQFYEPEVVYFYDESQQRLRPDPRYTALTDPQQLANWLLAQLISPPQSAPFASLVPSVAANQAKVTLGQRMTIEIPGAAQLDANTRDLMAAQVATTLDQAAHGVTMTITDGGHPVEIPHAQTALFTAAMFGDLQAPANSRPALYYLDRGGVVDAQGNPLPGGLGSGQYRLSSFSIATSVSTSALLVAGVSGPADNGQLLVGPTTGPLHATGIRGPLSRPSWVPNLDEAWVGDGKSIFRVDPSGKVSRVQVSPSGGGGGPAGQVVALRFSPEGARVALVLRDEDGVSAIWIGSVVRAPSAVSLVLGPSAISPSTVKITDVAWNDTLKLFAIGVDTTSRSSGVYEVQCDGSLWTVRGTGGLPLQPPDSITVSENVVAAVSAGGAVWIQHAGTWISLRGDITYGTKPTYLE